MMLQATLVGIGLSAATMMLHALGTLWWISSMRKWYMSPMKTDRQDPAREEFSFRRAAYIIGFITTLLVVMHVVEVSLWAVCYLVLPINGTPGSLEEAFYFSSVTFTSLGYGDLVIEGSWRILSGIQAMVGIMVFGWSSALLLTAFMKMLESSESSSNAKTDA